MNAESVFSGLVDFLMNVYNLTFATFEILLHRTVFDPLGDMT